MKLKINKACDFNSISVLPPPNRRTTLISAQQPRSQPSQHSFSQGVSSQQNALFSQISQTSSFDEILADNQRFSSEDKDNSAKRVSCLGPISYTRDESQVPISRSSANLTRRWSSAAAPEHKCQLSDELEHKIASIETLLSRLGMILDSVQADIMQVNKGTKELSLAVEGIRQMSLAHDDSFRALKREQEEIKSKQEEIKFSVDAEFRSLNNQLSNTTQQDKIQEILAVVTNLPEQIQTNHQKLSDELPKCLSGDLQAIKYSLRILNQKNQPLAVLPPKLTGADSSSEKPFFRRKPEAKREVKQEPFAPKREMGNWTNVKTEQAAFAIGFGNSCKNLKQRRVSPMVIVQARERKVLIDLDNDSDEDFSWFMMDRELENHLMDEVDEETDKILRKARRRKRKQSCKTSSPLRER